MAFLVWVPHLHSPTTSLLSPPKPQPHHPLRSTPPSSTAPTTRDVALLWYKHDLRIDDHPALVSSASAYRAVLPLYVFDRRIISRFSDETLELALSALSDLKSALQGQGSDLMIRFGGAESVVAKVIDEVVGGCGDELSVDVFAEEELEYSLREMMGSVEGGLPDCSRLVMWRTPFYDIKDLKKLPAFYSDFKKLKFSLTSPLAPPVLPHLDIDLNWGSVPSFDEVKSYYTSVVPSKSEEKWVSVKRISAISVLSKGKLNRVDIPSDVGERSQKSNPVEGDWISVNSKQTERGNLKNSVFLSRGVNVVGGGTSTVLNALSAYLRYLEGTARDDWKEVHEKLRNAESRSGASFGVLFRSALSLGIISRRRTYFEAIKYERERNGGFLSPFGYSAATVAAAADSVSIMEWYWLMASKNLTDNEAGDSFRIWRWKDYLIQYTVLGQKGPAILLIHGFGAFLEHFRDNMAPIADNGHKVWALTLLGFGKSEKPNIMYTELLWAELLRDFIVDVVGEPVHLVGNSIGGYISAIVAGLWPSLSKSVVLINTAGSIMMDNSSIPVNDERQVSRIAWLGGRLLLSYLRLRVGSIVKNCYPTNTQRADDWLINSMLRASDDPGVLVVLESVFSFNLSIPLNFLIESFGGKVLIIQGMKDPLWNSEAKMAMFRSHCRGIEIKELDAGHCPHDELPEEVNSLICEWMVKMERNLHSN